MSMGRFREAELYFQEALKEARQYADSSETERVLNNSGYLYLQEGDTTKARVYLQKAIDDYHSTGAQKVLKMTEEYDQRDKAALVEDNRIARIFFFAVDEGARRRKLLPPLEP